MIVARQEVLKVNDHQVEANFLAPFDGERHPRLCAKLVEKEELSGMGEFFKKRGLRVVFTTGVYDMIHVGHGRFLEIASGLGELLVVGLNSDQSVRELKGPTRPILGEHQRAEMLSFLASVNFVTIFSEPTGAEVIRCLKPDVYLCVEGSWEGDLAAKAEVAAMAEFGGRVYCAPRQDPTLSTTDIIRRISRQTSEQLLEKFQALVRSSE